MNKKKLLALLMALVMTLTLVPVTAFAETEPPYPEASIREMSAAQLASEFNMDESAIAGMLSDIHGTPIRATKDDNGVTLSPLDFSTSANKVFVFTPEEVSKDTMDKYGVYNCDFIVSFEESVDADSIILGGYYNTMLVPILMGMGFEGNNVTKQPLISSVGFLFDYNTIVNVVSPFLCTAINIAPENIGKTINVSLVMWPDGETLSESNAYVVATTPYEFTKDNLSSIKINNSEYYYYHDGKHVGGLVLNGNNFIEQTDPGPHFAPKGAAAYVACIGETNYKTLQEAVAAANDGETITLLADIEMATEENESSYAELTKSVTVDGQGLYTLSGGSSSTTPNPSWPYGYGPMIALGSTGKMLTLKNLSVNKSGGNAALTVSDYPNTSLTGVTVTSSGNTAMYFDGGTTTLTDCTVTNTGVASVSSAKWRDAAVAISGQGVVNIKSGTYSSTEGSVLTIFTSGGTFNISGGQFDGKISTTGTSGYSTAVSTINISGGYFKNYSENIHNGDTLSISGGYFSSEPSGGCIAAGYEAVENPDTNTHDAYPWTVVPAASSVAQVVRNDIPVSIHTTLQEAINAAQAGDTVKLLKDVSVSATVAITKSITLDGDNHTLTTTATRGIWIASSNVAVTIEKMKIVSSNNKMERSIQVNTDCDGVTLNLNNITTTATMYTVNVCGSVDDLELNINNCNLTGWGVINLWGNNGNVNITNSILKGVNDKSYNAVGWNDFGVVVMEGDTTGATDEHSSAYNVEISNSTIVADSTTGNTQSVLLHNHPSVNNAVTLTNCEIDLKSENCEFLAEYSDGFSAIDKVKGTYLIDSNNTLPTLPEGFIYVDLDNGYKLITRAVAQIGTTKYESLKAAFDAVKSGETITLLADCEVGSTFNNGAPLALTKANTVLNLNGKTITVNNNFSFVMAADNITVQNGKIYSADNAAKETGYNSYVLVIGAINAADSITGVRIVDVETHGGVSVGGSSDAGCKGSAVNVVLKDCHITSGDYYAVASQNHSTVTIESGTYISNNVIVHPKQTSAISPNVLHAAFKNADGPEGNIYVTGGNFKGAINKNNAGWIVISGGYFSVAPDADMIKTNYQVIANTDTATSAAYPYTVGEKYTQQSTTDTAVTSNDGDTTTSTAFAVDTSNVNKPTYAIKTQVTTVVNEDSTTTTTYKDVGVGTATAATVATNVKNDNTYAATIAKDAVAAYNSSTESATFTAKIDEGVANKENVLKTAAAANAIAKAAAQVENVNTITEAKVILQTTLKDVGTNNNRATVTYDITPVAQLYKTQDNKLVALGNPVALNNEDIEEGQTFTFNIPVPANMEGNRIKVSHVGSNGYATEIGTYAPGTADAKGVRYITVTVDHFSEFELEETAVDITGSCRVSASLTLRDSIDINFYVKELVGDLSRYEVKYSFDGGDVTTVPYSTSTWAGDNTNGYKFVVASCAAAQMNDTVSFEVYYDGVQIKSVTYSIRQYCMNKIDANSNQNLIALCKAVLDYGAYAQKYFGYKTGTLANRGGYTYGAAAIGEIDVPENNPTIHKADGVTAISASLNLKSKTELNIYFTGSSYTGNATVSSDGQSNDKVTVTTTPIAGTDIVRVTVSGISAPYLADTFTVQLGDSTVTYSPMTYAYRYQNDTSRGMLVKALYNYYDLANTLFNNN